MLYKSNLFVCLLLPDAYTGNDFYGQGLKSNFFNIEYMVLFNKMISIFLTKTL